MAWALRIPEAGGSRLPNLHGAGGQPQQRKQAAATPAIKAANAKPAELGIEPIGNVAPHGLRRTYASLRCAAGDSPVYTAKQLGHTDPRFTLSVYAAATKHRERLTSAERKAYQEALRWADIGRNPSLLPKPR